MSTNIDNIKDKTVRIVAPLMGAWIEIEMHSSSGNRYPVAPLVGAWIEIKNSSLVNIMFLRRSPRGSVD